MNRKLLRVFAGAALTIAASWAVPARAQMSEVKEKPPIYAYVSNWAIPRAQWGEMEKANGADQKILEKAMASGAIIGYGDDTALVHEVDGSTHDNWWASYSMAGLLSTLEQFYANGSATSPVLASSTKHWDEIFVSRYYNWHPGSYKGVYTRGLVYKLKADAPNDAVDTLAKNLFVPYFEKLLAEGVIHEYDIDTQAIHTASPDMFFVFFVAANGDGLDKANASLREMRKSNPMMGPAFGSMSDFSAHRDFLARTNATYK